MRAGSWSDANSVADESYGRAKIVKSDIRSQYAKDNPDEFDIVETETVIYATPKR